MLSSTENAAGNATEWLLLPVVPWTTVTLDEYELRRLQKIAARIAKTEPDLAATHMFGAHTRTGMSANLWLVIGDTREIPLAKAGHEITYEYRLSLLAHLGDLVVFGGKPHRDFEHYRSQQLGLGPIVSIIPRRFPDNPLLPLAERCRLDVTAFSQIVERTKRAGGLTIVAHIGAGSVWRLAGAVGEATGLDVCVASAPPRLTRRVNDKLWFARLATEVLGGTALPPTYAAHGPAVLAHRIRSLARSAERVVVKVPDSAGGAGNVCLAARDVASASLSDVKNRILGVLRTLGWYDTYPLLVSVWEAPVLSSPSVQLWIPAITDGPPIIEGLFEQILEGEQGSFVGSVPVGLPERWQRRLAEDAMRLASALQLLGYFGRCSLDTLLVGQSLDSAVLHWIECNGRWGGVSIPMTIANRLKGGGAKAQFVVVQRVEESRPPQLFADALRALDGILFKRGRHEKGIILMSPIEIEAGRGVQMLACAETVAAARELSGRALEILSGVSASEGTPDLMSPEAPISASQ
jgi:Pre ATP-grasp domain